jgi:hypothetical protein
MFTAYSTTCRPPVNFGTNNMVVNKRNMVCNSTVSKAEKIKTIITRIENQLPSIQQKLHNCFVGKMEDRHRVMIVCDINRELSDIHIMLNSIKNELDVCNYICSHKI